MKQLTSAQIRQMFLDYFETKGHQVLPSQSLIPVNDPTLLWINSGVATLKKYFDGSEVPDNPRITNSQKSIRTNDIENVGITARHHTLFEMLGNFSIGDYHKEQAIEWAWELLTSPEWYDFDPELLYVTYYPEDTETRDLWLAIDNFNPEHLIPEEGNFWDIGAGPCGPNTEIFYDRGEKYNNLAADDPENYPGGENERWLEIWNLVFSEFNHMPDDTYQPLPNKNVDTGMGLERITSVVQDTATNFETDLFMPIIKAIEPLTDGLTYDHAEEQQVSFKVIADHLRAVTFAISDGALPSNEGRGYILRRLIRRSIMHGRRLGIEGKFLEQIVPVIVETMSDYYPELSNNQAFIQKILNQEENRFHETLEAGEQQLQTILEQLKETGDTVISGAQAFQLYDTFGFPLELTQEEAQEYGFTVDEASFQEEMQAQKDRARAARSNEESMQVQTDVLNKIDTAFEFGGYDSLFADATIKHIIVEDEQVERLEKGQTGWVIFNRSPFYAEMGGQVADTGFIYDYGEIVAEVKDVQKAPKGQFMHQITADQMPLVVNQSYSLWVDYIKRSDTNKNHTATHLLHKGLKEILGDHVHQAGSYVGPDRLRFDFSHFEKVTDDQLKSIEAYVNQWIRMQADVMISKMPIDEAKALGAEALFGEKYGDIVRVVNIGNESIELCGGTHVENSNDIGTFKLLSEAGIGAGVRRIEAITGEAALQYYQNKEAILESVQVQLKAKQIDQIIPRLTNLQQEVKDLQEQVDKLSQQALNQDASQYFDEVESINDLTYIALSLEQQNADAMRQLGDMWRDREASNIFVIASDNEDSASIMVFCDEQAIKQGVKAGDLIKPLAKQVGGGGGGRPTMAQAGGKNAAGIPDALNAVPETIQQLTTDLS
ncbi:alanine--tRNA ligase [Aerococcaceae bacterium DSM 111020]|nr:alanine--tRNA ligase [Aerococcaceae bacterium DSM 111020]